MIVNAGVPMKVGVLISPNVALMDLFGAHAVFGMVDNVELHIIWKNKTLLQGSPLFPIAATTTFEECPPLDVLIVGAVPPEVIADEDVIGFIAKQATYDPYLIGICGGVLLLGAAGLLRNRAATTNLHLLDTLPALGARVIAGGHVEKDGKLYTAGPATGGFEAALMVLAQLRGEETAKLLELTIEYHPRPPFGVGTPELAGPLLTAQTKEIYRDYFAACSRAAINYLNTNRVG
ncbi:Uncharacterised protein [Serratia proteamaculans]|uniref:DJ-1/PfpI family protein n=1 Tax=Serratia proteamaculans TaxID=28151 RepID=UPI002179A5CA|nr:DJ-1/PfpI family protein [Serratia proteamaculans]CAI0883598.1 Uncharacterised protein [Serratia proteamaculans]CAI1795138.1 Uncharacterised protein [Serratia proteamaculans]